MTVPAAPIEETPKGVKVELRTLQFYPDGHVNITFADGTNWPLADPYEAIAWIAANLLRPALRAARRKAAQEHKPRAALRDPRGR